VIGKSPFEGVRRVVLFNWPLYALALAFAVALLVVGTVSSLPIWVRILAWCGAAGALWQAAASLAASYWVYDASPLHSWSWLKKHVPAASNIINVHAGYDETSESLARAYPEARLQVVDFYEALPKREPSIEKAQKLFPGKYAPISRSISGWPVAEDSADLIVLAFAAHELREPTGREAIFREAARVLAPHGKVVLVEHLRDMANFVAFGPGFMHFIGENEWRRCPAVAHLRLENHFRITPFVGVFVLCK
jgi:SAM-dependent methyltransferase